MKKLVFVFGAIALLSSCGGESDENTEIEGTDSTDSTDVAVEEVEGMDLSEFEYFDDYGKLTNKTDLYATFGEENLEDDTVWFAEGEQMFMCTHLTDPSKGWRVNYVFDQDDEETVSFIEANFQNYSKDYEDLGTQKVEASNGLHTGMSMADLVVWNESDFDFMGFGWDYEGGISAAEGSKISESKVMISLTMDPTATFEGFESLYGDHSMNSSDEGVNGAPIVVSYMSMFLGE